MPNPTARALHVDVPLTMVSVGYRNLEYVADEVFPLLPVMKQSDIIPAYDQSHWFRDVAKDRAAGTKSEGGSWKVNTTDTYFCRRKSIRKEIPDEIRANADAVWNLDNDAANYVADKCQLAREVSMATSYFTNTGVWGTDKTGGADFSQWSDYGASNPLVNITDYQDTVEGLIGRTPGHFLIGKLAWSKLRWHPAIIDLIKFTQRGQVSTELFASLLDLNRVLIGKAIYTTSQVGTAEASVTYSRIWGKNALLYYRPATPSLMEPSAGYTFVWQVVPNAIQYIKRMRDEEREVDIIEANTYYDQEQVVSNAGLFMKDCAA